MMGGEKIRLSITAFSDFPAISHVRMTSLLHLPVCVSGRDEFEESIVASEYFCGVFFFFSVLLLRYEAAGLDAPAAAAAVSSSCCQAFLKRGIMHLEK